MTFICLSQIEKKEARRSPVTASQSSAETSPRPQVENRLRAAFPAPSAAYKIATPIFHLPLRRAFYL